MEQRVVEHLRTVIRERLSEARTVKDIVWLLETAEHMGGTEERRKFVLEVQDRALQLVVSFPHSDVRLLVRTLARLKLRPTPLLQALAFYLSKGPKDASPKEIVSLFHAFHALSFPEPSVLLQLSTAFVEQLSDNTKASLVAACFTGVGQLSWRHCDQLFPMLLEELSEDHFTSMPSVWLDIVWSLAALGKVKQTHLDSVLQPHFYTPLLEDSSLAVPSRQKLLNIITVNDLEFPDGPCFPKEMVESIVQQNYKVPEAGALQRSVREALTQLAPLGRYFLQNPSLPYGLAAGNFCCIYFGLILVLKFQRIRTHLIVLVVLDYKDLTLHSQVPTGVNALRMRLLKHLGYKVLQPFREAYRHTAIWSGHAGYLECLPAPPPEYPRHRRLPSRHFVYAAHMVFG
ncbi:hypothetical protein HPB51_011746 [Rhipicephalus microplus]|uniref:FAST kinase leucine-rich domain-containing protein n=1 Tax=Rhipicephalus microplus TaxID=6941 RepID=A0A9J6DME2_RHIMP|nr:hypothetical protein HPB51_011746 [Rhipicephalus microplus]